MKRHFLSFTIVFVLVGAISAFGSPLRLDYSVTDLGGGLYDYNFDLVLDNNDSSWTSGNGWGWIVFGDANLASSPLTDFVGDPSDLPIGPYTLYATTGGLHNGPTLDPRLSIWTPSAIGDLLSWSGTSTADLAQGSLLFSTIESEPGTVKADFEVANRLLPPGRVPEPQTLLLLAVGLFGLASLTKRKLK